MAETRLHADDEEITSDDTNKLEMIQRRKRFGMKIFETQTQTWPSIRISLPSPS